MSNLHISLTEFKNESRVLKETKSILEKGIAKRVYIASLYSEGLDEDRKYSEDLQLRRFKLTTRRLSKNIFVQMIKYLEFFIRVYFYYKNKRIKMVNIHALSLLPIGVTLKYVYGAKLVYDTHELETETNGLIGLRQKLSKFVEKYLIKKADLIFVVSNSIADWYRDTYGIRRPKVIMNAPRLFKRVKTNYFRDELGIKESSTIMLYQGGLSKGRGVELLLEAFKRRKNDDIVMVFMGEGELQDKISEISKNSNNIFLYPLVSLEVVLSYTSSADIGIHMISNTCLNHDFCMPNKFFEYAMVGLPVIVSNMEEMKRMVKEYDMGIVVEDEDFTSINRAIDKILSLDMKKMKLNARKCAEDNSWEKQEIKMINEYKRIFGEK